VFPVGGRRARAYSYSSAAVRRCARGHRWACTTGRAPRRAGTGRIPADCLLRWDVLARARLYIMYRRGLTCPPVRRANTFLRPTRPILFPRHGDVVFSQKGFERARRTLTVRCGPRQFCSTNAYRSRLFTTFPSERDVGLHQACQTHSDRVCQIY